MQPCRLYFRYLKRNGKRAVANLTDLNRSLTVIAESAPRWAPWRTHAAWVLASDRLGCKDSQLPASSSLSMACLAPYKRWRTFISWLLSTHWRRGSRFPARRQVCAKPSLGQTERENKNYFTPKNKRIPIQIRVVI